MADREDLAIRLEAHRTATAQQAGEPRPSGPAPGRTPAPQRPSPQSTRRASLTMTTSNRQPETSVRRPLHKTRPYASDSSISCDVHPRPRYVVGTKFLSLARQHALCHYFSPSGTALMEPDHEREYERYTPWRGETMALETDEGVRQATNRNGRATEPSKFTEARAGRAT